MSQRNRKQHQMKSLDARALDALEVRLRPKLLEHEDDHDGWVAMRPRTSASRRSHDGKILITEQNERHLRHLVRAHRPYVDPDMLIRLEAELDRALIVDESHVPSDVVTMNSRVLYEDEWSGDLAEVRLVYRKPTLPGENHVSVLAPIGAALLGLSVGQPIVWPYGGRDALRLRVAALLYQPEADGAAA